MKKPVLSDYCEFINGGAWKESEYTKSGVPVLKVSNMKKDGFVFDSKDYLSVKNAKNYTKNLLKKFDVVIATVGSHPNLVDSAAGRATVIPKSISNHLLNQNAVCLRTKNKKELNQRYLGYLVKSEHFQNYIQNRGKGAANQMRIPIGDIKSYPSNLPPQPTQRKIAKILSAYDDLIENNLKRIKLLEEMAQKTYEEWFVRFKFPGHENTYIDKETGLPKGWKKERLKNYLSIKHGYAYKGEFFTEKETNRILLTPGNFKIGGGIQLKKVKYYSDTAESPKDYILERNDLLLTMTDLSKMGDTLGYPLLIPSSEKLFLHNQRLGKVQLISGDYFSKYFLYFLFKDEGYRAFVVGSSSGATVKHTSPNKILSYKAKFPDLASNIVKEFERKVKPIFDYIDNLQKQNQRLKEARDILLPRLMTGMIDVEKLEIEL